MKNLVPTKKFWLQALGFKILTLFIIYFIVGNLITWASAKRVGAECCDQTTTSATDSGACSHHGGVRRWKKTYWYSNMDAPYKTFFKHTVGGRLEDSKCED